MKLVFYQYNQVSIEFRLIIFLLNKIIILFDQHGFVVTIFVTIEDNLYCFAPLLSNFYCFICVPSSSIFYFYSPQDYKSEY